MLSRSQDDLGLIPRLAIALEEPALRRQMLTLLGAQGWDVRAYETATGALNDPRTLSAALLLASETLPGLGAPDLVDALRKKGWRGKAILVCPCAEASPALCSPSTDFAAVFDLSEANHLLIELIEAQLD